MTIIINSSSYSRIKTQNFEKLEEKKSPNLRNPRHLPLENPGNGQTEPVKNGIRREAL